MTYNYQIQVQEPGTERYSLLGAMRYKEAVKGLQSEAKRIGSTQGYIWPQTTAARRTIHNVVNGADYLLVSQIQSGGCVISGVNLQTEADKALALIMS